jgi:hypothetical protein
VKIAATSSLNLREMRAAVRAFAQMDKHIINQRADILLPLDAGARSKK